MCLSCWHCVAENCAEDPADIGFSHDVAHVSDSGTCLSCWHCIAENCAEDPADNSRASKKECNQGQTCQVLSVNIE